MAKVEGTCLCEEQLEDDRVPLLAESEGGGLCGLHPAEHGGGLQGGEGGGNGTEWAVRLEEKEGWAVACRSHGK